MIVEDTIEILFIIAVFLISKIDHRIPESIFLNLIYF